MKYDDYKSNPQYSGDKQMNPLVIILDDKKSSDNLLTVTQKISQLEFPASAEPFNDNWKKFDTKYKRKDYRQIVGLFDYYKNLYFVAKRLTDTRFFIFRIGYDFDVFDEIEVLFTYSVIYL